MIFDIVHKLTSMLHFIFKLMISDLHNTMSKDILLACGPSKKSVHWSGKTQSILE